MTTIDYDKQEAFLSYMTEELKVMNDYARKEELFVDIEDVIKEISMKMHTWKLENKDEEIK